MDMVPSPIVPLVLGRRRSVGGGDGHQHNREDAAGLFGLERPPRPKTVAASV